MARVTGWPRSASSPASCCPSAVLGSTRVGTMAMRGDAPMRKAARDYGELLSELAEPVKQAAAA